MTSTEFWSTATSFWDVREAEVADIAQPADPNQRWRLLALLAARGPRGFSRIEIRNSTAADSRRARLAELDRAVVEGLVQLDTTKRGGRTYRLAPEAVRLIAALNPTAVEFWD